MLVTNSSQNKIFVPESIKMDGYLRKARIDLKIGG